MNRRYMFFALLFIVMKCYSQDKTFSWKVDRVGAGVSYNAVADEAIVGLNIGVETNILNWNKGDIYLGIGILYGVFPNTNKKINEFLEGRSYLTQPFQAQVGHHLYLLKKRLDINVSILSGPSVYTQKITIDDEKNDINESYKYKITKFTAHAKVGLAFRLGQSTFLESFSHLPIGNNKIAPYGLGIGISKILH